MRAVKLTLKLNIGLAFVSLIASLVLAAADYSPQPLHYVGAACFIFTMVWFFLIAWADNQLRFQEEENAALIAMNKRLYEQTLSANKELIRLTQANRELLHRGNELVNAVEEAAGPTEVDYSMADATGSVYFSGTKQITAEAYAWGCWIAGRFNHTAYDVNYAGKIW